MTTKNKPKLNFVANSGSIKDKGTFPNPLGDVARQEWPAAGFCAKDLLVSAAELVPAWQRDSGDMLGVDQVATIERQSILSAFTRIGRVGVIVDERGSVVAGTTGWTRHVGSIATLTITSNCLVATSPQSQYQLTLGLGLLFADYNLQTIPVALRDLDGWVTDIVHFKRVGPANPNRAYAMLPKSAVDVASNLENLSLALRLTAIEINIVQLIIKGQSNREMAVTLNLKPNDIKRGVAQVVAKFKVRRKSDIVRVMASFP